MPNFPQNPYVGQVVTWQGLEYEWNGSQWVNLAPPQPFAVPVFISASAPQPPITEGTFWFNTVAQVLNIWVVAPGGSSWVPVAEPVPANTGVIVSISPPEDPTQGTLWYNPHTHLFQVWVVTGITSQWEIISDCEPDVDNPPVVVSISPPTNPVQGTLWFKPTNQTLSLWVDSLSGGSWIILTSNSSQQKPTVFVSSSPPGNPTQGDLWFQPQLNELRVWNEGATNQWLLILGSVINGTTPPVYISVDEPVNPKQNYLWFNPQTGELLVRNGAQWDLICTTCDPSQPPATVSVSPPQNPVEGNLWFNPITGILSVWYVDLDGGQWLATVPYALIEAAAQAASSAEQAAASAALAQQYANLAASFFSEALVDSTQPGIIYVGKAPPGTLETDPAWSIKVTTFDDFWNIISQESFESVSWVIRYSL